ncbi:MAG: autotransporter domain-containing protein [Thermodesulfovibrionales bacterium]|jgi:uncharacterized protein with beta-barrel porin domain
MSNSFRLRGLSEKTLFLCLLSLSFIMPFRAADAAAQGPDYAEAVLLAIGHASHPNGWHPPSLFVLGPDAPASEGLVYDNGDPHSGALVVRTATKSSYFSTAYVGQSGYQIYNPSDPQHTATWVTTGNDVTKFLLSKGVTGENVTKLLEKGLGMNATGTHDAIVEFTVKPGVGQQWNDVIMRPTRNPDVTRYLPDKYYDTDRPVRPAGMSQTAFDNFSAYYRSWRADAYNTSNPDTMFPWTQLGYTFFWGDGYNLQDITGMSEFILLGGTPVGIYGIYATPSYIYTRNDGADFSTAADAQFGNGFAGFRIDGPCATLWAGHRFQNNVRRGATPNQILIEKGGSVTGGEGILAWSLNYDLVNSGIISGPTSDKFGISGTANIAVLFRGDRSTAFGTPITTGVNRLTNDGTISSPGTAIRAEAGGTIITNNSGGIISGGVYAIQTGAGNDSVTVNGGEIFGAIDLGAGTDSLTVTGASDARLTVRVRRATATVARIMAESVSIADNTQLAADASGSSCIRNNDRFLIADAASLTVNPDLLLIQNDSSLPMITFSALKEENQLLLTALRDTFYYRQRGGNPSLGATLDALVNTATGDMAAVLGALDRSGSPGNARRLEPVVDGGVIQAGYGTFTRFSRAVLNRLDQLLATGESQSDTGVWAQGFGGGMRQSSDSFSGSVWGAAFGFDRVFSDRFVAGFSGGYARSRINGDQESRTDVDSYQGSLYGGFSGNDFYIDGLLSLTFNRYDAERRIAFGVIDRRAESRYDGRQYSGYLEGGYTLRQNGLLVTPLASIEYTRLSLNDYTERGAGSLDLSVDSQEYSLLQSGLGARLTYPIVNGASRIVPEIYAKWLYDFIGDRQEATATLAGGGSAFTTQGFAPPRSGLLIGARLNVLTKGNMSFSLNYDLELKKDFYSHGGFVNFDYAF